MLVKYRNIEDDLLDIIDECRAKPTDGYAIYLPISKLGKNYNNEFQQKIITNILKDIFKNAEVKVFFSSTGDLFVVYMGRDDSVISKSAQQLNYLFVDDVMNHDGKDHARLCEIYDLKLQIFDFNDRVRSALNMPAPKKAVQKPVLANYDKLDIKQPFPANAKTADNFNQITIYNLPKILTILQKTDCLPALRSQPICLYKRDTKTFKPIIYEIYLHIRHLNRLLYPGTDLLSDPYLFRYITPSLDKKVLGLLLRRNTALIDSALSINLSLATILSKEFEEINEQIHKNIKNEIIIEIQMADLFADITSFSLAVNKLRNYGYKLALDGLNALSFQQINRQNLGFDMVKLYWEDDNSIAYREALKQAIEKADPKRVILSRCNNAGSVNFGLELGVSIFQGRYIDLIVNPNSKITN
ncbi:MAG: EAL domain-containing protein [Alphaproteobacteria bacterium]